jgi:hypothetical protein
MQQGAPALQQAAWRAYSGEVEMGVLRANRGSGDVPLFAGYVINCLVPRPEPVPSSLESGDTRPKLPRPGSAPVVPGVVVQSVVIPPPVSQNGADHQAGSVPKLPVLHLAG